MFREYLKSRKNEMIIAGVMFGVMVTIGFLITGDISEAVARRGR